MLKVRPHKLQTLGWWREQYLRDRLDMNPPYQRRSYIWGKWKQAHLIDSILNDFDVPKFYVANFLEMPSRSLNKIKRPYAIIDGKQRLQAIFDFFDDKFGLNQSFTLYENSRLKLGGATYSTLKAKFPHIAEKLDNFVPAVMNVVADDDELIEELFVRLNSGEAATGAERRNAMPGPVPVIVRELVLHPFFQHKIRFTTKRMQDFNLAAKILLIETRGEFVDTKARNLDEFAKSAIDVGDTRKDDGKRRRLTIKELEASRDRVFETLELLSLSFSDRDKLLGAQGHIPVYYWVARGHPELVDWLRDFLVVFTEAVSANLRVARLNPNRADPELTNYYTMARTTNDQASLQGRYEILIKRLEAYSRLH